MSLHLTLGGEISPEGNKVFDDSFVVLHRSDEYSLEIEPAVLPAIRHFTAPAFAAQNRGGNFSVELRIAQSRTQQHARILSNSFRFGVTGELRKGRVRPDDPEIAIDDEDDVTGGVQGRSKRTR